MKVAWYVDDPGYPGGAELAAAELRRQAPSHIQFVADDPDVLVLHNCVQLPPTEFKTPFVKVVHDVWPHGDEEFREYILNEASMLFFSSPLHVEQFPHEFKALYQVIPPAMDLRAFRETRVTRDRDVIWVANNLTSLKGQNRAQRWAFEQQTSVDYYGKNTKCGPVSFEELPKLLSRYRRFLYLPNELEPFGRTVAEAWAADLELIVDRMKVGAMWWIDNRPQDVDRGAQMFWRTLADRFTPTA